MLKVQLDFDLAEYYKLVAVINAVFKDGTKVRDCIDQYISLAIPEMQDVQDAKEQKMLGILDNLDKWVLEIDPASLPQRDYSRGLIPKDTVPDEVQERLKRKLK